MPVSETPLHPAARENPALFAPTFQDLPYWHDGVDLRPAGGTRTLPQSVDVAIIGGGYTGLSAAAVTASAGRTTAILEAATLGTGCSGLNGGQASTSIKPSLGKLRSRFGDGVSRGIIREGIQALEETHELVARQSLDCDWQPVGRFLGAHSPKHFERLLRTRDVQQGELGIPSEIVNVRDQHREIATDFYHGGLVYPRHAAVQPAKLVRELCRLAVEAGATYHENHRVTAVQRDGQTFRIQTSQGTLTARNVIIATNGYTGPFSPWHRRRVIPIGSQIVATERLPDGLVKKLLPTARVISDTRRVVVYYRASPDGTRIVFGGRATLTDTPATTYGPLLIGWLRQILPQLGAARISHAWRGTVAYTFDELPHLGENEGVHYCMGYCGSGVSLSTYFGRKIGLQVLGNREGNTALDGVPFQTRPMYTGYPWFLVPSILVYRILDNFKL
jgi:glycine/D-amino acid oxidase-like deaminating enzyme